MITKEEKETNREFVKSLTPLGAEILKTSTQHRVDSRTIVLKPINKKK